MDLKELKKLIAQGEGLKVDFKRDLRPESLRDVSKDIAAFANTEGGHIIVGVDNKGTPLGVDWDSEKTTQISQEGLNCVPPIKVNVHEVPYPKLGMLVAIEVPKSNWIHLDANKRFPQRLGERTSFMDFATLLALAKGSGLIKAESQFQVPPMPVRQQPAKVTFLTEYLSDPNPSVRAIAVSDIGNVSYNYAVEDIPALFDKLFELLGDVDSPVRLATLNMISAIQYRLDEKKKRELMSKVVDKMVDTSIRDKDIAVRSRALSVLAEMGEPRVVSVFLELILSEPPESYMTLGIQNHFMSAVEGGLGLELKKRLFEEASKNQSSETQRRLKEAMGSLSNFNWAR